MGSMSVGVYNVKSSQFPFNCWIKHQCIPADKTAFEVYKQYYLFCARAPWFLVCTCLSICVHESMHSAYREEQALTLVGHQSHVLQLTGLGAVSSLDKWTDCVHP